MKQERPRVHWKAFTSPGLAVAWQCMGWGPLELTQALGQTLGVRIPGRARAQGTSSAGAALPHALLTGQWERGPVTGALVLGYVGQR